MRNFKANGIFIILVALLVSSNFCLRKHYKKLAGIGFMGGNDLLLGKEQATSYSLSSPVKYKMDGTVSGSNMEGKIYKPNGSVFASWYLFKD